MSLTRAAPSVPDIRSVVASPHANAGIETSQAARPASTQCNASIVLRNDEDTTTQLSTPLPRAPPSALRSHLALAASQLIFAASMTIVRAAFIESNEVSPIIIIGARLLLSLAAFTVIHFVRMYKRRGAPVKDGEKTLHHSSACIPREASLNKRGDHNNDAAPSTVTPSSSSDAGEVASTSPSADEFHDLTRSMKIRCVALGIAGGTVNMLCASTGVKYANAITSGAFQCAIPPLTCFMAYLFCKETMSLAKIMALAFAVAGNMIMVQVWCVFTVSEACGNTNTAEDAASSQYYMGCLFLLTNVTAYSAFLVFQRPVVKLLPKSEFLFRTYLYGFVGMLIVVLVRIDLVWHQLTTPGIITRSVLIAIGFAGLVNSTFAYYLVSVGISGVSPAAAAIYFCLQPLFVTVFSTVFLGEGISFLQAGGGILILAGLLMSAAPNMPTPKQWCHRGGRGAQDEELESGLGGQQVAPLATIKAQVKHVDKDAMFMTGGDSNAATSSLVAESPRNIEENTELGDPLGPPRTCSTHDGIDEDEDEDEQHHLHPDGVVSYTTGALST